MRTIHRPRTPVRRSGWGSCPPPAGSAPTSRSRPRDWMARGSTGPPAGPNRDRRAGIGIAGFRQSHNEAAQARRVAELAGRPPGTITRYAGVALAAISIADLEQARTFVRRELQGLTATDDATARPAGTLRTYLEERSSRSRTAKRLGIHENTVSYRVKQAEVDPRPLRRRAFTRAASRVALVNVVRDRPG